MKKYRVGIDLGTSYCSIAFCDARQVRVLRDREADPLMPSAVYFSADGSIKVGKEALIAGESDPERLLVETKRLMGDLNQRWRFNNIDWAPVDIATILLQKLRTDFERVGSIERAVICVPALYGPSERDLVRQAALRAGLPEEGLMLVDEPVAASLTQIVGSDDLNYLALADDQLILVYDLGGGTFDLSLVSFGDSRFKVVRKDSNLSLGGADWNNRLAAEVVARAKSVYGVDLQRKPADRHALAVWVERTKRSFSKPDAQPLTYRRRIDGADVAIPISLEDFESLTRDLADETRERTLKLIRESSKGHEISQVLAVGGSTHMPMIKRVIESVCYFTPRNQQPNYHHAPELAVVEGAALFTRILKSPPRKRQTLVPTGPVPLDLDMGPTRELEYVPVSGHGLGVALQKAGMGTINRILIPRNSELPAKATISVNPGTRGMRRLGVIVVEGDEEKEGRILGSCVLEKFPYEVPTDATFTVTLEVDKNNLITVYFTHVGSGVQAVAQIKWGNLAEPRP